MSYLKQYPKMAYASLGLLASAVALFWADWVTVKQPSLAGVLMQMVPELKNGGISFADGRSLVAELARLSEDLNSTLGAYLGSDAKTVLSVIGILNIVFQLLFFGTILAAGYCVYARLTWKSGLKEGIYFLFFLGDLAMMYFLMSQLNSLLGKGTFGIGIWGFAAFGCALLSEILWEEASFHTPKPGSEAAAKEV